MNLATVRELRQEGQHEEARRVAVRLAAESPHDALVQYEAACIHDGLGLEAEAVPYYQQAIAVGLTGDVLRSAYLGLGSTFRTLGRHAESLATFERGLAAFPGAKEFLVFRAMTLHNLGQSKLAVESLLQVIADTTQDPHIQKYARAIAFYAQDVERKWGMTRAG